MKAVITLVFILFLGISVKAQADVKINVEKEFVAKENFNKVIVKDENSVARLYKCKNYRVITALSFVTKQDKSKLV